MATGGGPPIPEKKSLSDLDTAVPHLGYEVTNCFDSDGIFLSPQVTTTNSVDDTIAEIVENSVPYLVPSTSMNIVNDDQRTYTTLANATLPNPHVNKVDTPKLKKCNKLLEGTSGRQKSSVDRLMTVRLKNADIENKQAVELHEIRMEIEKENLRAAKLRTEAAELQLKVVAIELEIAKCKHEKEVNK